MPYNTIPILDVDRLCTRFLGDRFLGRLSERFPGDRFFGDRFFGDCLLGDLVFEIEDRFVLGLTSSKGPYPGGASKLGRGQDCSSFIIGL